MADHRDLKLCGIFHFHLEVCILSGQEDPIIFLWVTWWWIQERWQVFKSLYSLSLIDRGVEILDVLQSHFHLWCVYYRDRRIQFWVMVDPRGVEGAKYLVLISFPRWPIGETWNFVTFIVICRCSYSQNGRIFLNCGGSIGVEGVK
jgi:hypothetical protein